MKTISLSELKKLIDKEPDSQTAIVDVREESEYTFCHINGTINIPFSEFDDRTDELQLYDKIICLCAHGVRAKKACDILKNLGHKNLFLVDGAIEEWQAAGLTIEQGPTW